MRSSGASGVPPATYQRMALDFGEIAARRDFKQRHLAVRILGEEFRRVAFAFENVDLDQPIRHAELRQGQPRLVAVAGSLHRIERKHRRFHNSPHRIALVLRRVRRQLLRPYDVNAAMSWPVYGRCSPRYFRCNSVL